MEEKHYLMNNFLAISFLASIPFIWKIQIPRVKHVPDSEVPEQTRRVVRKQPLPLGVRSITTFTAVIAAVMSLGATSWYVVPDDHVGHLYKIYGADLPEGQIIAIDGEKGHQAWKPPGFHFEPLIRVLYDIEDFPFLEVVLGTSAASLGDARFIAPSFEALGQSESEMLSATFLLKNGSVRSPPLSVLEPGKYPLNYYPFAVENGLPATRIAADDVGVVKSNVASIDKECNEIDVSEHYGFEVTGALAVPLVPKGCIDIWNDVMLPGT